MIDEKIAKMFHNYESGKKNFGSWRYKLHEVYNRKLISIYHHFHLVSTQDIETGIYVFIWCYKKSDLEGLLSIIEYTSKMKPFNYTNKALYIDNKFLDEFKRRVEKLGN